MGWILLCTVWAISLSGCSVPALQQREGDVFFDSKTGVSYRYAPLSYTAREVSEHAVARIEREIAGDLLLYAVEGRSDQTCLATAEGVLLCATDWSLPELSDLSVSEVIVYETQKHSAVARFSSEEEVKQFKSAWKMEPRFALDELLPSVTITAYDVCFFASGEYEGLAYCLKYFHCSEEVLLYDAVSDRGTYESIYDGIPMTFEEYGATADDGTELYAVYHFGTELFYDVSGGWCCRAAGMTVLNQ